MTDRDEFHMRRAIQLAELGRGSVEPNPMVGAVVASGSSVLAEGYHEKFGHDHAEVVALNRAGSSARGATIYVTLEPCAHQGKTPPCVDAILRSGVKRVVAAMVDPFPKVSGKGSETLRAAGLEVSVGVLEREARALNAPYLKLLATGRPYVHAKWAMTLDGKIATVTGESKWISGEESRRHSHEFRSLVDGILVGIGTVLADNPSLTARPPGPRVATRIILDSRLRTPFDCELVRTARQTSTLIATTAAAVIAEPTKAAALRDAGCEVLTIQPGKVGINLAALLDEFGKRRWTNVLVEGGAGVLGSLIEGRLLDAARVYIAPRLVGGEHAKGPVGGAGLANLADSLNLDPFRVTMLGQDVFLSGVSQADALGK